MSRLMVRRKAHRRKSYIKDVKRGKGVKLKRIPATRVKGATFTIRDIGARGRSIRPRGVPQLKKGRMTEEIERVLGRGKIATELSDKEWAEVFRKTKIPAREWLGMLGTQVARRKYAGKDEPKRLANRKRFERAISILAREKKGKLIPKEAIYKWSKVMTPRERALAMPERGKRKLAEVV